MGRFSSLSKYILIMVIGILVNFLFGIIISVIVSFVAGLVLLRTSSESTPPKSNAPSPYPAWTPPESPAISTTPPLQRRPAQPPGPNKYCIQCGASMKPHNPFCTQCGRDQRALPVAVDNSATHHSPQALLTQFQALHELYQRKEIDATRYNQIIANTLLVDEHQQYWVISTTDFQWYRCLNGQWLRDTPQGTFKIVNRKEIGLRD